MSSIKCFQCGLVNWATATECKRCGSALALPPEPESEFEPVEPAPEYEPEYAPQYQMPYAHYAMEPVLSSQPIFSGGIIILLGILNFGGLMALLSGVRVLTGEPAAMVAVMLVFGGLALLVLAHFWLVIRIFEQSTWWGLGALFIPVIGLVAVGQFWEKTKRSFVAQFICAGIMVTGFLIGAVVQK
jgi:hypothetical protein